MKRGVLVMRKLSNIVFIYFLVFNVVGSELPGKKRISFIKKKLHEIQKNSLNSIAVKEKITDFISNEINMLESRTHPYDTFSQEDLKEIEAYLNNTSHVLVSKSEPTPSFWDKIWNLSMTALPYILLGMVFVSMLFFQKNVVAKDNSVLKGPYVRGDLGNSGHFKASFTHFPQVIWKKRIEDGINLTLSSQPIIANFGSQKYIFTSDKYMFDYYLLNKDNGKIVKKGDFDPYPANVGKKIRPIPIKVGNLIIAGNFGVGKFDEKNRISHKSLGKKCINFHIYDDNVFCFTSNKIFIYNLNVKMLLKDSIDLGSKVHLPYSAQQGSIVYLSGGQTQKNIHKGTIVAFDMRTRKVKWAKKINEVKERSNYAEKLIVKNNFIYFFTQAGILYALDPLTGKTIWKNEKFKFLAFDLYQEDSFISLGSLASNGEYVYACLSNNRLIKINAKYGIIRNELHLNASTCRSPVIFKEQVVFGLSNGTIKSVSVKDINKTLWEIRPKDRQSDGFMGSPLFFEETLYFLNVSNRTLYAIASKLN